MRKLITTWVICSLSGMVAANAHAQNLLTNPGFEDVGSVPEFVGWTAIEENVDQPSIAVDSVSRVPFADRAAPPEVPELQGLWLKPWSGATCCEGQNYAVNGKLTQTVPAVVGDIYTFSGWSRFESNYSGGVDFLDSAAPVRGGQASPTETIMSIEFLDSGGGVIGSPTIFDVRADRELQIGGPFPNDFVWYEHTFSSPAVPVNAANVRVTAAMLNGVANINGGSGQSARMDDFSLMRSGSAGDLLVNGNLNTAPPPVPEAPGWTITEPTGVNNAARGGGFADNPLDGPPETGSNGFWLRAFAGGDAMLSQQVDGIEGGEYTFSAWAAFGANYSGGTGPAKPGTLTLLELAFLNADMEEIEEPLQLDLWDEGLRNAPGGIGANPQAWDNFSITGTSPAGTAFVEVRVVAQNMVTGPNPDPSAFLDDFSLTLASAGLDGDHNQDGTVDAADYVLWRKNPSAFGNADGYNAFVENFGESSALGGGSGNLLSANVAGAVPEPASWMLALTGLIAAAALRRSAK